MKKLRAAVVGVGYLGNFHAQKYKSNSLCQVVGVCDARGELAKKRSQELAVPYFTDPKDLVGKVDLVTIAASTTFHFELASLFLNAGIPVNVEKPMTATLEQAEKLFEIQQKKNVLLTVGHIERFNPSINELIKQIGQDGYHFEFTRWATFKARGSDVSVVYDLMIHDLDLLFFITQSEVKEFAVSGSKLVSKEADNVQASFKMANGQSAYMTISRVSPKMIRSIKAYGQNKIVHANTATLELDIQALNHHATADDNLVSNQIMQVNKVDALQEETNHFIDCVLGNCKPSITVLDGLKSMIWANHMTKAIYG